jgi:RNA polymerase sigma-70 factor (ECF subfamily)
MAELYGAALRLEKNQEDAEDLVAEAVSKAWANRRSLKKSQCFRPWVFRILTNSFVSRCRERATRPSTKTWDDVSFESGTEFSLFEKLHQPFLLWWSNPEKEFLNKLLARDIEKAIDGLPESFRVVVVLAELHGFSYEEIAKTLGVPLGTVRSRLARGRGLLQKALWEHGLEAGLIGSKSTGGGEDGETR